MDEGLNFPGLSPVLKVVFGDDRSLLCGSVLKIYLFPAFGILGGGILASPD